GPHPYGRSVSVSWVVGVVRSGIEADVLGRRGLPAPALAALARAGPQRAVGLAVLRRAGRLSVLRRPGRLAVRQAGILQLSARRGSALPQPVLPLAVLLDRQGGRAIERDLRLGDDLAGGRAIAPEEPVSHRDAHLRCLGRE